MDRIQENQQHSDDMISDPNLLLAVAMVKSISSLIDYNQGSGEEQDEQKIDQNAGRNSGSGGENQALPNRGGGPDEMIELTPIQDLSEKVKSKKLLSKEELTVMITCLQMKFTDLKGRTFPNVYKSIDFNEQESLKLKEFLTLVFYAIINTYSYSYCHNYLEKSAHQRLSLEALNLMKRILESLSKKDQDPHLYHHTLPIVLKFLSSLQNKASYDQAQYRYLRTTNLSLATNSLTFLNQYLSELAPELYGLKKGTPSTTKVQIKQEEGVSGSSQSVIALPYNNVIEEDESLEKALEFVPIDYSTMTSMLNQHLQSKLMLASIKDEEMSQVDEEEEKSSGTTGTAAGGKDFIEACKEHIQKLKIIDLLSKAIDQMVTLYDKSVDTMCLINTSIFPRILRSLDSLPQLKLKSLPNFLQKRLLDKFLESQAYIINSIDIYEEQQQQQMEIDQQSQNDQLFLQQNKKGDHEQIKEKIFVMAKCLEIMIQVYQTNSSENSAFDLRSQTNQNFEAIIKESLDFKYLVNLVKFDQKIAKDIQQGIFSISQSLIQYLLNLQKDKGSLPTENLESFMIIITNLICINKVLVTQEQAKKPVKKDNKPIELQQKESKDKQTASANASSTAGGIRTRNQVKKEQTSASKEATSEKKKPSSIKQEETKPVSEKKSQKQQLDFRAAFRIDHNDVLKHSLSVLIMMIPHYLKAKTENDEISISRPLIKNLYKLAYYPSQLICRLVYGILAEFTKPALKYTQESQELIISTILKQLKTILSSNTQTVFTMKLMILLKNSKLNFEVAQVLIQQTENWQQKKTAIKSLLEIYESQNLKKYLLYICSVSFINNNEEKATLINNLIGEMHQPQKDNSYFLNLHLLQILLLTQAQIAKFKGLIGQYMMKLFADNEADNGYVGMVSDVDKQVTALLNNKDQQIYNTALIQQFKDSFDLQNFLNQIRTNILAQNKSDQRSLVIQLLRQIIRINSEINQTSYDTQSFVELIKEFERNDKNPFINSLIDRTFNKRNQTVLQKIKDNQVLDDEDLNFMHKQLQLIQVLSKLSNEHQVNVLSAFVDQKQNDNENIGGVKDTIYAQLLFDFIKITNVNIKGKIQQQVVSVSTDDNKIAQTVIDQVLLFKTIFGLQSQQDEDNLYSHALSNPHKDEYQIFFSNCLLLKSIYSNLVQFVITNNDEQYKDIVKELAFNLLQVKYDNPYLEFSETNNSFDHDISDKILQKSGATNLANKDFQRVRQLDQNLSVLVKTQEYLNKYLKSDNMTQVEKDQRKFIFTIANEITGVLNASNLKSTEDMKLFSDYITDNGDNSQFFKGIMKSNKDNQIGIQLWYNAFIYLDQSLVEFNDSNSSNQPEDVTEKKGGVQLTISFSNTKAPVKRGALAKRALLAKEQSSNVVELQPIKAQVTINLIAQKLFNFLSDLIMLEKDSQTAEAISTSYYLRSSILQVSSSESQTFIQNLIQLNQIPLLKKIISSLITNNPDSQLKDAIRQKIFNLLIQGLQQDDVKEEFMMLAIEIAQIITENNKQLLQFISTDILKNQNLQKSAPTKFLILDFLCQLGQSKFSKVDGDHFKYNVQQIMDTRKKQQQDKQAQLAKKKLEDQKRQQQEDQELDLSSVTGIQKRDVTKAQETSIDGFKQEKFIKDDTQFYQKYMEKPEDLCTFIQTKKEFKHQHWYFCYTCGLTGSNGCCAVCARRCHKGHHVIYSRKSNFFCDCGESGKCQSLSSSNQQPGEKQNEQWSGEVRPQTGRRRTREEAHLQDKGMFFKNLAQAVNAGPGRQLDDGGRLFSGLSVAPGQGLFGMPPNLGGPPPSFLQKYELPEEDDEDEASLIFQHFGGILERPPGEGSSIFQRVGQPQGINEAQMKRVGQFQFLSESSEEDMIMREENEELLELQGAEGDNQQPLNDYRNVNRIMKLIQKESKPFQPPPSFSFFGNEGHKQPIQRKDSSSSISQISQINPLEDPLSEASSTPMHTQQFTHEKDELNFIYPASQNTNKDDEMEDVGLVEEVCELLRIKQFPKKLSKMVHSPYSLRDTSKAAVNIDMNLLSIIDSNKDGLVAICDNETEVTLYASSQFFDEANTNPFEPFVFDVKEGQQINKIETYSKLNFNPTLLQFNTSYPYYLAVAGIQQLEVLTLSKQGKVQSRLSVDLLLEIISKDLTIVNIQWVPGSQTMLAVATRDFVKIYDLAEDNISPTHNFMIFNGYISDFSFGKEQINTNGIKAKTTIYIGSTSGSVYYQDFTYKLSSSAASTTASLSNKQDVAMSEPQPSQIQQQIQQENDNSDLMLTKTLQFDLTLQIQEGTPCISLYYSHLADMLLITFQGGHTVCGNGGIQSVIDSEQKSGAFSGFKINPVEDHINQATNLKTIYTKHGENIVCFKDIGSSQIGSKKGEASKVYIQAISRKANNASSSGVPIIIEISETNVDINILRSVHTGNSLIPALGMTFVRNSNKNSAHLRQLVISNDGSCNSYSYQPLNQSAFSGNEGNVKQEHQSETISKFLSQHSLIKKQDLPKEVKMPINFFEKMKNVYNDNNLKAKLQITGDIVNYFKTSKATFEALSKIAGSAPVITEAAKKVIKMNFKLDASTDHLITGIRFKLDQNPKTLNTVSFKLFNRVVKLKTKQAAIWYDVGFCDAEVIYGSSNSIIETEFITEDVNSCPIKIFAVEVYAQSRKEFGLRDKLKRIEKLNSDQQENIGGVSIKEPQISNEEQVKNEMLKTRGIPVVTWKEKQNALKNIDARHVELIITLDVITQYIEINSNVDSLVYNNLVDKLKILLHQSMIDQASVQQPYLVSALKRCLTKILSILKPKSSLGDPLNYQTIKDQIFIQVLQERLESYYGLNNNSKDLDFSEICGFIHNLSRIYRKRHYQIFKIIEANKDLIQRLTQIYLRLYKQTSVTSTQKDIQAIVALILANYYQQINKEIDFSQGSNIQQLIINVYENENLTQIFSLLHPFIINADDHIQKLTLSTILKLLNHYAKTTAKTLKYNQLPIVSYNDNNQQQPLLIVDFSPHILRYLFGLIRQSSNNGDLMDLAYSLVYKIIKVFEFNCQKVYINFSQFLIDPIVEFIKNTMIQPQIQDIQLYDNANKGLCQVIYVNLVLINMLMQEPNKSGLKIKAQRLSLEPSIRDRIINQLDSGSQQKITKWMITLINNYQIGFKEGKCSYRTKTDEGIPGEVTDNLNTDNSGVGLTGVKLLRPIVETLPWKWHPLFIQTDGIFEVIDRKVPTQALLLVQFIISSFREIPEDLSQTLIKSIRDISMKKPASFFLLELGEQAIRQILIKDMRTKVSTQELDDSALKEKVQKQINQTIKSFVVFQEFVETFEPIYHKFIKRKALMTFNMQFQIHNMLQQLWIKASQISANWSFFIADKQGSQANLLQVLFESALNLNEDSSLLCLALCALAFETSENDNFVVRTLKLLQLEQSVDIFKLFHVPQEQKDAKSQNKSVDYKLTHMKQAVSQQVDLSKLIDSVLLGRNKKQLRVLAAFMIKGIYETQNDQIIQLMFDKIPSLQNYGVNSQEFIAVLSYIINREIQQNKLTEAQTHFITREIYNEILQNNLQLTAHPNLELYSTLQRVSQAFQSSSSEDYSQSIFQGDQQKIKDPHQEHQRPHFTHKSPKGHPEGFNLNAMLGQQPGSQAGRNRKITNPFMLENEACSKCYEQRSMPFQNMRMNDVKSEAKYTDSTMIVKLNATYTIKQIQMSLHDIKGVKVIKTLNFYVNSKQGVDLADMKNNWNYWKRVKSIEVEVGQKTIIVDFALPINASNLLIEFQTVTLSKPLTSKDRAPAASGKGGNNLDLHHHIQVTGIDTVIQTLPKELINRIGVPSNYGSKQPEIIQNNGFEKENMNCPRCGKAVQGKHGICNSCGENALQCTFCRNINYEKPDAYLCNECGFSRFAKFDFSMTVKQGFASEKIENDEQKNIANQQIETHLQTAQTCYQQLMKRRTMINQVVKRINEGYENQSLKVIQDMFGEECSELYQKMMKSLNNVKILKSEIDQFTQGSAATDDDDKLTEELRLLQSTNQSHQSCFSCIQEYLKSQLNFLQSTAQNLSKNYQQLGLLDLLYHNNLRMHSIGLQEPARQAICSLIQNNEELSNKILEEIKIDLFLKKDTIPAHLLSQNISQESYLVLDLVDFQATQKSDKKDNFFQSVFNHFWNIFFASLIEGQKNASFADQITAQFANQIKSMMKKKSNNQQDKQDDGDQIQTDLMDNLSSLFEDKDEDNNKLEKYFTHAYNTFKDKNFLIQALILPSSQDLREEAKYIITYLVAQNKPLQPKILVHSLQVIQDVLSTSSLSSDQYFDILTLLLNTPVTVDSDPIYVDAFEVLFKQIDAELNNLVAQENQKKSLGQDGFMPQLSTGQLLSRLVTLVSSMVKESSYLKGIIQSNVNLVIKSFLKIRKLNLTKNKMVQNSEVELERMFKELHSEKEQDREKFILECIKIIESGDCDLQEMRFLFEEICKVIDPIKPEHEYLLNLHKAQSQEFYFRGKMSKNPYTSTSLGKTMADVRIKICKEMELAEPELVELLVAGKIVGTDLTIKQVYEQVYWPALCKQRDPESYEVPNIEDAPKSSLSAMSVTFRLMGIDGEATEDRVEQLSDGTEGDSNPANIEKKYGITQVLTQQFQGKDGQQTNGIKVLLGVLERFGQLQKQRYLAEWLFKLITYSLKIKINRQELSKNKQAVGLIAKRLFESVGMQSQIENQKGITLFDTILSILEQIVVELNLSTEDSLLGQDKMDIDQISESQEAAIHVEIFIQIMADACNEMNQNYLNLDKTSKKIRAVSKILPFLINKEDTSAIQIIADFIVQAISQVTLLDNATNQTNWTNKHKFTAQFNLERAIEILESTPALKNFLKDQVLQQDQSFIQILDFLINTSMKEPSSEMLLNKFKLTNQNLLRIIHGLVKNHPSSQTLLQENKVLDLLYQLTQAKFKDKQFILLAQDIVESLTNKNHTNDPSVQEYLRKLIDQQNEEKKRLAQKKKEEIMRQMQQKKVANKFLKQVQTDSLSEENGPKCVVCLEGYTKKPTDILGMYVFAKKLKICEMTSNNSGFINTNGYTTVTHSNYIHFLCHQNAYRADAQLKQPKKEWEGAVIRNDHTKCNNLFPMKGGNLPDDSYYSMVEKNFTILTKTVGQCDSDKVNVVIHDFKMLVNRLAYEDSFSRDTQGGGPEHNMHLIPFLIQMVHALLRHSDKYQLQNDDREGQTHQFTYVQEKRLFEFLEQGMKKKQEFMSKLEEEKKYEEIEEEEKFMDEMSSSQQDEGEEEIEGIIKQMNNFKLDQIAYQLTQCIVFSQFPIWEQYKKKFLSIILCTISGMREDKGIQTQQLKPTGQQTDFATGKKVLTISKSDNLDIQMAEDLTNVRRRRLSSDNKIDQMQKALQRIRPLLIQMRLVDLIKQRWDAKRLGLIGNETTNAIKQDLYLQKLSTELIEKGNLQEVITECDEIFREYKDRMLKIGSVEEFLQDMGMMESIIQDFGSVEQYVLSHF